MSEPNLPIPDVSSIHQVPELVDHLFRHKAGQMVSTMTRTFGPENLQLAEDVVQDALIEALQQWPYRGVPQNPGVAGAGSQEPRPQCIASSHHLS